MVVPRQPPIVATTAAMSSGAFLPIHSFMWALRETSRADIHGLQFCLVRVQPRLKCAGEAKRERARARLRYAPITPPKKKIAVTTPCSQAERFRWPPYCVARRNPREVWSYLQAARRGGGSDREKMPSGEAARRARVGCRRSV